MREQRPSMQSAIEIVPFVASMQQSVSKLITEGLVEHWGFNDPEKNPDLVDIASSYGRSSFFVALYETLIVGTGAIVEEAEQGGRIVRMSVSRQHRRLGVGAAILQHLEQEGKQRGYTNITLETTEGWADATSFYLSQGYEVTGCRDSEVHFIKLI
ncbi:MAG: GNAT family N-acetyltransferase [Pseudomonadota bacterium]